MKWKDLYSKNWKRLKMYGFVCDASWKYDYKVQKNCLVAYHQWIRLAIVSNWRAEWTFDKMRNATDKRWIIELHKLFRENGRKRKPKLNE